MNYEGKVYRPWPEYRSILIQTTLGCSINTCTFCSMFDDKRFKVRPIEDVIKDIEEARLIYPHVESIFLIDGNVMAARTDYLLKIFDKLRSTFPECKKISLYSGLNDFRRKTIAELKELKDAGLDMAYSGLESGDRIVLERIKNVCHQSKRLKVWQWRKKLALKYCCLSSLALVVVNVQKNTLLRQQTS